MSSTSSGISICFLNSFLICCRFFVFEARKLLLLKNQLSGIFKCLVTFQCNAAKIMVIFQFFKKISLKNISLKILPKKWVIKKLGHFPLLRGPLPITNFGRQIKIGQKQCNAKTPKTEKKDFCGLVVAFPSLINHSFEQFLRCDFWSNGRETNLINWVVDITTLSSLFNSRSMFTFFHSVVFGKTSLEAFIIYLHLSC